PSFREPTTRCSRRPTRPACWACRCSGRRTVRRSFTRRAGTTSPTRSHRRSRPAARPGAYARAAIPPPSGPPEHEPMATHTIRLFGDPVLKRPTALVDDIDGTVLKLVDAMYETMYEAPGVGLAAPQVGVQKRFFVYDVQDDSGPHVIFNPQVVETSG